jgi:lysozyme
MLNGIDISGWQEGLDLSKVPCDFVIIKGTGGTSYVSPTCDGFMQQAKALGKLTGVYHFAREAGCGGTGTEEARWFVANCGAYFDGTTIPVLDFETDTWLGQEWAREWLDEVYRLTGVRPLFYTYLGVLESQDFSLVANGNYGLWLARYGSNTPKGYEPNTPVPNSHSFPFIAMYQYCSQGRLAGWNGNLDLNVFFGDAVTWYAYAQKEGATTKISKQTIPDDITIKRYNGADRYKTADLIVDDHIKANKVVVHGESYADGISACYLAKIKKANIVFDKCKEINGLDTYTIGGDIKVKGTGIRSISGANRYDTNLAILKECSKDIKKIIITSGKDWADGISTTTAGLPVMLVSDYISVKQAAFLEKLSDDTEYIIIGGTSAVSQIVSKQIADISQVTRIDGGDRYETSAMLAECLYPNAEAVILVNAWADAIAASNIGEYPILLLSERTNEAAKSYIKKNGIKTAYAIGNITDETLADIFN